MTQTLFISHSTQDRALADLLKDLFRNRLKVRGKAIKVFCSSDIGSIETGKAWFDQIMRALHESKACVSLLTPNSIYRPWVIFESGGAFVSSKEDSHSHRMFPVCAHGISGGMLPGPLTHIQATSLETSRQVGWLFKEVAAVFGITSKQPSERMVSRICREARRGPRNWENVQPILLGSRLDSTPFSAAEILKKANRQFFCAGQNLSYLANSKIFKGQLFAWLKQRVGRRAHFLICDPDDSESVLSWSVVGSRYSGDLTRSKRKFQEWLEFAKAKKMRRKLNVKQTKLVTTGIVCADPDTANGILVLTPVVAGHPISGGRPHFVLNKTDNLRAFDHYWEVYRDEFSRARPLRGI